MGRDQEDGKPKKCVKLKRVYLDYYFVRKTLMLTLLLACGRQASVEPIHCVVVYWGALLYFISHDGAKITTMYIVFLYLNIDSNFTDCEINEGEIGRAAEVLHKYQGFWF